MKADELFLHSDAALREVVDQLDSADFSAPVPKEWSELESPTLLGIPFHLSPELIDGLNEHVVPHADEWRQWGVFPPAIETPAGADEETRLLCAVGYWVE